MKPKRSENAVVNEILEYLQWKGIYAWHNKNIATYDAKLKRYRRFGKYEIRGVSDILGVLKDGRILCIECKTGYNKTTQMQDDFINEINSNGGMAFVARGIEDIEQRGL